VSCAGFSVLVPANRIAAFVTYRLGHLGTAHRLHRPSSMTRAKYTLPLFSAVATFLLVAACSAEGTEGQPSTTAPKATSSPPPPPSSASSPVSAPVPEAGTAAADAGIDASSPKTVCQGTKDLACFDCCDQHYPAARETFWGCFCDVTAGLCVTECGKDFMCGGDQDSGAACYACFDTNVATCDERYAKAKASNQEVRDYDECTAACPLSEPDPAP
jgi:hypothetical protein